MKSSAFTLVAALVAAPLAAQAPRPAETASAAVEQFFGAAADSNLTRMSQLFGTEKGSAARTNVPSDHAQRMVVMQAALAGVTARANGETATNDRNLRLVTTELSRGSCRVTVPVRAVKAREGWLVLGFELEAVWDGVNRPCAATGQTGNNGN